ncbi:carboxypeptidase family protein [Umboniibacter marinipuniceus]|uniref:Carboxypeptidase family protein n=1 Tax=Umboniibacter marinipuniceus TaxID=569599 RepID=A0A3M0ACG1_9GAMM|nr:carboxypeptidase family protein [Umboniibacter marinipuniceus]
MVCVIKHGRLNRQKGASSALGGQRILKLLLSLLIFGQLFACVPTIVTYTQSPEVVGWVIDETGNPVSGARVTLRDEEAIQYDITNEFGEFRLEAVEETRSVILMAASSTRGMLLTVDKDGKKYSHTLALLFSGRGYLAPNESVLVDPQGIRSFDALKRSL